MGQALANLQNLKCITGPNPDDSMEDTVNRLLNGLNVRIANATSFSEEDLEVWFEETRKDLLKALQFNANKDVLLPLPMQVRRLDPLVLAVSGIQQVKLDMDQGSKLHIEPRR